jgi:hypothetical protein
MLKGVVGDYLQIDHSVSGVAADGAEVVIDEEKMKKLTKPVKGGVPSPKFNS